MITVNTYWITERAVYEGVALGIQKLMSNPAGLGKTEEVVDSLVQTVMSQLTDVLDFGIQPVRFTNNIMGAMWKEAQAQAEQERALSAKADAEEREKDL